MKKIIRTNREGLNRILEQAVKNKISERIRKASLNEWEDDGEEDDYTSDLLNSDMFNFNDNDFKSSVASKLAAKDVESEFSDEEEPDGFGDDEFGEPEPDDDLDTPEPDDEMDDSKEDTPVVDTVKSWSNRGGEMEIDGIPITQKDGKFSVVAKESDPEVTITGSDLDMVKRMYQNMWNRSYGDVASFAYEYGMVNYKGILINNKDASRYGVDINGLPLVINTDELN